MQRLITFYVVLALSVFACRQTDIDPAILAGEIKLDESLRPIYLESKVINNGLEVSIRPEGDVVCCCAPCPQASYKSTARYEVLIASSDEGPYRSFTTIPVGSQKQEQYASQSVTVPGKPTGQPIVVRVVAIADNGKAGYVRAIMNSTSPIAASITEIALNEQNENLGLSFNSAQSQVAYATYVQDASYALIPTLYVADYAQGKLTNKRVLTPGGFGAQFSRDGKKLAYFLPYKTGSSSRTLIIHDVATMTDKPVELAGNLWIGPYTWSPDGQSIAFLEQNNEYTRLWKVGVTNGKQEAVTGVMPLAQSGGIWQGTIDWLPNGQSVAVTRKMQVTATDSRIGIALISPVNGQFLSDMNTLAGCIDKNPAYSPNGQQMAFISSRTSNLSNTYSIWVRDLATGQLRHLRLPDSLRLSDNSVPQWAGDNALLISAYSGSPAKSRNFIVSL